MLVCVAGDGARKGPHAVSIWLPGVLAHRDTNWDTVLQAVLYLSFPVGNDLVRGFVKGRDNYLGVEVLSRGRVAGKVESGTILFLLVVFVLPVSGVASIGAIVSGLGVVKPVGHVREVGAPLREVLGVAGPPPR